MSTTEPDASVDGAGEAVAKASSNGHRDGARSAAGDHDVRRASRELIRFLPDVGKLLWRLARDSRVPWTGKVVAGAAVVYVASPIDVIPDFIPGAGQFDDILIVVRAIRFLFRSAGYELMAEHWDGTDEGFAALLVVAGIR